MRETPRSLRAYFMLVGFFTVIGSVVSLASIESFSGLDAPTLIFAGVSGIQICLGLAYCYIGGKLQTLLRDKPQLPLRFATLAIILSALQVSIIGVLINVYIYYQLKRMAKEATPEMESQVLE